MKGVQHVGEIPSACHPQVQLFSHFSYSSSSVNMVVKVVGIYKVCITGHCHTLTQFQHLYHFEWLQCLLNLGVELLVFITVVFDNSWLIDTLARASGWLVSSN